MCRSNDTFIEYPLVNGIRTSHTNQESKINIQPSRWNSSNVELNPAYTKIAGEQVGRDEFKFDCGSFTFTLDERKRLFSAGR